MAWAAMASFVSDLIFDDQGSRLYATFPKWKQYKNAEQFHEQISDYQMIEAAHKIDILTRNQRKGLHGLLNGRNESAHPSDHDPDANEALGYISEVVQRIKRTDSRVSQGN